MSASLALIHVETDSVIPTGEMLLHADTRVAWRYEGIVIPPTHSKHHGQHMIRVSTYLGAKLGRAYQVIHPHVFGCVVKMVEALETNTRKAYISTTVWFRGVRDQIIVPVWLGLIAWFVLAVADHYHLADFIFTAPRND